jgi:hypothetical protein
VIVSCWLIFSCMPGRIKSYRFNFTRCNFSADMMGWQSPIA